jgi:hypothetical protein
MSLIRPVLVAVETVAAPPDVSEVEFSPLSPPPRGLAS